MITTITRSLVRRLRAVLRRAKFGKRTLGFGPRVHLACDGSQLRIQALSENVALQYTGLCDQPAAEFWLPLELLADCDGTKDEPVTLEANSTRRLTATWTERGIPCVREYATDTPSGKKDFPSLPETLVDNAPGLWTALHDALSAKDDSPTRFALNCLQLHGQQGRIAATDGRQVLIQQGFQFPWADEVLIPGLPILGCRELAGQQPVGVGKTAEWLAFLNGPWTVWLRIETGATFPKIEQLIRDPVTATSRLVLDPGDARLLASALPKLPGGNDNFAPVTLDLGVQILCRSQGEGQSRVAELVLGHSNLVGAPLVLNTNRRYLIQAAELGFTEICFFGNEVPVQCHDERRQYIWALLSAEEAVKAVDNPIRIEAPQGTEAVTTAAPKLRVSPTTMPETNTQSQTADSPAEAPPAISDQPVASGSAVTNGETKTQARGATVRKSGRPTVTALEQAIALRDSLRRQAGQAGELVRTIKRQRREAQLVKSTLASLKQLQVAG